VSIRSLSVGPDFVEALVVFEAGEPLRTSDVPDLPARMLALLPGLRGHRCDNGRDATFADELADTELAHLLEHGALEVMALAGSPDTLCGRTSWDFARDGAGVFRVRVEYDHDLVALGALGVAERAVAWAVNGEDAPDIAAEVARLRMLRTSGADGATP